MTGAEPSIAQLRPALQLALDTARAAGSRSLPGKVRALVGARRLPGNWAVTMARVLDGDAGFRAAVAERAERSGLGEIAWLWLVRPDGWEGQVARLVGAEDREKEERRRHERLLALEGQLDEARSEVSKLESSRAEDAAAAEEQRRALQRRVDELEGAEAALRAAREELCRRDAAVSALESGSAELRERLVNLQADREALEAALSASEARAGDLERRLAGERVARDDLDSSTAELRSALGESIARAGAAAGDLGRALAGAAATLGHVGAAVPGVRPAPPEGVRPAKPAARDVPVPAPGRPARPRRSRRQPLALPPGVLEDSPEAARHLVRAAGSHLVVDGYNVALTSWDGDHLPALRDRLVAALSELAVRLKRPVTVVFDGASDGGRAAAPPAARPWLTVVFSPSSVQADEVIVDTTAGLPSAVPVVVATNDREVRAAVRSHGANVVSVDQLLAVLGRRASRK